VLRPFDVEKRPILYKLHADRRLSADDLRVAFFLIMPADDATRARVNTAHVAKLAGMTIDAVRECMRRLEGFGYCKTTFLDRASSVRELDVVVH
jgi:hypothetical protein